MVRDALNQYAPVVNRIQTSEHVISQDFNRHNTMSTAIHVGSSSRGFMLDEGADRERRDGVVF